MDCREAGGTVRRAAVTGIGVWSPFGKGRERLLSALCAGESALGRSRAFPGGFSATVPESPPWRRPGRARVLALEAVRLALADAGLPEPALARTGLVLGTIVGEAADGLAAARDGQSETRRRGLERAWSWDVLTRRVARRRGLGGASFCVSTACASGADALGLAAAEIVSGRADAVVAGGVETLTPFQWEGFRRLGALDPAAVRPFDRRRGGTGLGEGACLWVIEEEAAARRRGARILGWLAGWATCADAVSLAAPRPDGVGLFAAARRALSAAGLKASDLSLVVAHATGTTANDRAEALALRRLFGEEQSLPPVTGIKGAAGHCLGAAAALEAAAALGFLEIGQVPPAVGHEEPDAELGMGLVTGAPAPLAGSFALTLSAGFGGQNAALVLEGGSP